MSVLSPPPTRSFHPPKSSVYATLDPRRRASSTSSGISTAYAQPLPSSKLPNEGSNVNPDELFTKYTVSEVRTVQQRLKADAEAKQEELRLMVGERYRDLLQASSSIISIAKSSQNVLNALVESKEAIASQHILPLPPKSASLNGLDDRHLSTLQVLSAHMKLLLDAPEHLWRLIERRSYLRAAWLFLLSRVVHRALVRQDDSDEQSWFSEGVDVLAEFPLVQRQWEVVSQFRPQIIHKSTLSLREAGATSRETCATLVTLHLLDSRPLTETLSTLLSQRTKTLQSILSWTSTEVPDQKPTSADNHSKPFPVREVTQTIKKAFTTISQTVVNARVIFQDDASNPALISIVLRAMQEDKPDAQYTLYRPPDELQVTTQTLLTQLTSSANFQLLPANLRSYKPYVDLDSSSAQLPPAEVSRQLQEWFTTSCDRWKDTTVHWLRRLQTLKDVWTLRISMRRSIGSSGLNMEEVNSLSSQMDTLYRGRIVEIWQNILSDTETKFMKLLNDILLSSKQGMAAKDDSPVDFLFQSTPIPILSTTVKSFVDTPFQKYQLSLKRQLIGRTILLDSILSTVEQCARAIQQDYTHMKLNVDDMTRPLIDKLLESHQPSANTTAINIIKALEQTSKDVMKNEDPHNLVFLSRVADNLMSSSSFIDNIGCTAHSAQDFKLQMYGLNQMVIHKWGELAVHGLIRDCRGKLQKSSKTTGLSNALLQGLLSLCDKICRLGVIYHPVRQDNIVQEILRSFITLWIKEFWDVNTASHMHDILLLHNITTKYGDSWNDLSGCISKTLESIALDEVTVAEARQSVSDYLVRSQTLFAALFPPPSVPTFDTPLARFGTPATGQTQQPAIDIAKPSPRFGMLLVGSVTSDI